MLEWYVKEFCAICAAIYVKYGVKKGDFIYIDKEKLVEMLNKNAFETANNKLHMWRDLRWIDTDKGHFTRNVILESGEKRRRMVKISYITYRALESLLVEPQIYSGNTTK